MVKDELLIKYNISCKQLSPELAERVRHLQTLREQREQAKKPSPSSSGKDQKSGFEVRFPVLDEFVPEDRQTDINLYPTPKSFNSHLSIIAEKRMTAVLELWQFIHSFGNNLEISPMPLHILMSALEHDDEDNSVIEAIVLAFMNQFTRTLRSSKVKEERMEQYLGNATVSDLPPFVRHSLDNIQAVPEGNEDLTPFVEEFTVKVSKREANAWYTRAMEFLWEIRSIPEVRSLFLEMHRISKRLYELPGSMKVSALIILRNFYLTCVALRPAVDKEVDIAAEAKHNIRELETERRRIIRESQELQGEHDVLTKEIEETSNPSTLKQVKKQLRSLEMRLGKNGKAEDRINHEIDLARNRQYEHSAVRMRPLGEDRFGRRYWWLDSHLIKPSARQNASGIILIEDFKDNSWSYYDEPEKVDELIAFLNPLGCREARLGATLTQHKDAIIKCLVPFPHSDITPVSGIASSDSDTPVISRRRTKRKAEDLPEFLRWRNTFKSKK